MNIARSTSVVLVAALAASVGTAFEIPVHDSITRDALSAVSVPVGSGADLHFSERAMGEVQEANEDMDSVFWGSAAYFHPERHFTNESFAASSTRLITLRNQIVTELRASPPRGERARELLGHALHAVQDFYSHSNWVELGNSSIHKALGRNVMTNPGAGVRPCPVDPNILATGSGVGLTSGYFIGGALPFGTPVGCRSIPNGKCYHGNWVTTSSCDGMNKDRDVPAGNALHAMAVDLAQQASTDYVQQVLDQIAGDEGAIRALLDMRGTVGFVVDDTGSMSNEIAGVKATMLELVDTIAADPDGVPDNWLLERFGDRDVGVPLVTTELSDLVAAINGISVGGGGDCPELSQSGLLRAIDASAPGGTLFLYSDAPAKDKSLVNTVISRAQAKGIALNYPLSGSCSGVIASEYRRAADETGGQLFVISSSEVPLFVDLFVPQLEGNLNRIASESGALAGGMASTIVPVDGSVTRLVVSVSVDFKSGVGLLRPSGEAVLSSDADVSVADLSSGCILTVVDPAPGAWTVEVAGSGTYSVVAQGNTDVAFDRFDFVALTGDIHGGYSPIAGQPLEGEPAIGEARLAGMEGVSFQLVDTSGVVLATPSLVRNHPGAPADHFVGEFELPLVPFRVVALGTNGEGVPICREFPAVYQAQPVQVGVAVDGPAPDPIVAGASFDQPFLVTNLGQPTTYSLVASDTLGIIDGVTPSTLSLGAGEQATVNVRLRTDAALVRDTADVVTLTASKTGDAAVFNSSTTSVPVRPKERLHVETARFTMKWRKDDRDSLFLKGRLGGAGLDLEAQLIQLEVTVGGEVIGPPLIMERKGQRWLAKGKGFLASLHAKTHVFLVNLSRVSLRDGVQAVHDMTDGVGVAPVEVALSFTGANLESTTVATTVGFDYKARATRTVRGRYQYKPGVALNEVFLVTQGVARQVKKQPRHVVRLAGPVVGLSGLDLKLDTAACGEVRVTIGSAEPVVLTSCDFKASGPPSKRAYTLKGKHEAIKKLTWSNASRSFQLVTKPLDVGIPVDTDDLVVPLDVRLDVTGPTGARTSLVATTQLVRSNARSKRWTH